MTKIEELARKGIHRSGSPERGFTYAHADGSEVSAEERARIEELKIPPAWTEVAISLSPGARLQAVGKDTAGRWQYRYHESFVRRGQRRKFERLLAFSRAMPRARARVMRRLRSGHELTRERVLAGMVRILGGTYLRPGSAEYTERNGSYGLTTLRRRHVSTSGDRVRFDFPGKGGKRQLVELRDRPAARLVRQLLELPGGPLFRYRGPDGRLVPVTSAELNAAIKELLGGPFTAKDFRTWAGTFVCAAELMHVAAEMPRSSRERRRIVVQAIRKTASVLQNTPTVARASYIDPRVIERFEGGRPPDHPVVVANA